MDRPARRPFIKYKEDILGPAYTRVASSGAREVLQNEQAKQDRIKLKEETSRILEQVLPKVETKKTQGLDLIEIIKNETKKLRAKEVTALSASRDRSIRFGFMGLGQGGSRLAETFHGFQYPVLALNTSSQDLQGLHLLDKYKVAIGEDGAGKDMEVGTKAVRVNRDKILSILATTFEDKVDHIIIAIGGGGGTGSGGICELIDILQYGEYRNIGVIMTLPLTGEDTRAKSNTIETLKKLVKLNNQGIISPFIIIDNAKIMKNYPGASTTEFWGKANTEVGRLFHLFNMLTYRRSPFTSLDPADYRSIMKTGGFTIFGRTTLGKDKLDQDSIREAIDNQISQAGGLLADGFNVIRAQKIGGIIVGKKEFLQEFPRETEEFIFDTLMRYIRAGTVYRGVYDIDSLQVDGIELLTIWSGLDTPANRIRELHEESKQETRLVGKKVEATAVEDILGDQRDAQTTSP